MNGLHVSPVAVIDIGSNSIKSLVARRAPGGGVQAIHSQTIDARISAGISASSPRLSEAGIVRGMEAVITLLAAVAGYAPVQTLLVATSAVRDAQNGAELCERVRTATGLAVRILTGDEEANLIGRGLTADPALQALRDFYVFDLGGGSLECLSFRGRRIDQAASLPLGCVRLTERFIPDARQPFDDDLIEQISVHTRTEIARAGFAFSLPPGAVAVGTGGTVATIRGIVGARHGRDFAATDPQVPVPAIREMLDWLGRLPLAERLGIAGLPAARADVFPTALATLLAVAECGGFREFTNSLYNLRFGVADEALGSP